MLQFQMPNITREQLSGNRARFEVEPLDRGFGHTFGNALRRVLLSSLEGAAVSSVKIEGVAHEFSTVPGVKEDVTDIILNLKNMICRLHGESPDVEVRETHRTREPFKIAREMLRSHQAPEWLSVDAANLAGAIVAPPTRDQMPLDLNEQLVVEYYSR